MAYIFSLCACLYYHDILSCSVLIDLLALKESVGVAADNYVYILCPVFRNGTPISAIFGDDVKEFRDFWLLASMQEH